MTVFILILLVVALVGVISSLRANGGVRESRPTDYLNPGYIPGVTDGSVQNIPAADPSPSDIAAAPHASHPAPDHGHHPVPDPGPSPFDSGFDPGHNGSADGGGHHGH